MNKSPHFGLTRVCSSCGQQKPLSAFLLLSVGSSSTYGNICSRCRKTTPDEASGTSTTGHKIDAKTKIQMDIDKKAFRDQTKVLDEDERESKETLEEKRVNKIQTVTKNEQKHREEIKKGFFQDSNKNKSQTIIGQKQFFADEKTKKEVDLTKHAHVAGQAKHSSVHLLAFKQWVGDKATILKNIEKMGLDRPDSSAKNPRKK